MVPEIKDFDYYENILSDYRKNLPVFTRLMPGTGLRPYCYGIISQNGKHCKPLCTIPKNTSHSFGIREFSCRLKGWPTFCPLGKKRKRPGFAEVCGIITAESLRNLLLSGSFAQRIEKPLFGLYRTAKRFGSANIRELPLTAASAKFRS